MLYFLLKMFRMLVHSSSGAYDCVCGYGWVGVCWRYGVVRLGWCGILMQAEALVPQPA